MFLLLLLPCVMLTVDGSCVMDIPNCDCPISPLDATCAEIGLMRVPRTFARLRILRLPWNYIIWLYDEDIRDLNVALLDLRGQLTGCVKDRRTGDHPIVVYGLCDKVCIQHSQNTFILNGFIMAKKYIEIYPTAG